LQILADHGTRADNAIVGYFTSFQYGAPATDPDFIAHDNRLRLVNNFTIATFDFMEIRIHDQDIPRQQAIIAEAYIGDRNDGALRRYREIIAQNQRSVGIHGYFRPVPDMRPALDDDFPAYLPYAPGHLPVKYTYIPETDVHQRVPHRTRQLYFPRDLAQVDFARNQYGQLYGLAQREILEIEIHRLEVDRFEEPDVFSHVPLLYRVNGRNAFGIAPKSGDTVHQ
jgi:hypothetical protein